MGYFHRILAIIYPIYPIYGGNFIGSSLSPWAMGNSPSIPGRCHGPTLPHFIRSAVRSPDCHRTHRSNNDPKETTMKLLEVPQFHSKDVDLSIFINERSWIVSVKHCSFSRQLWVCLKHGRFAEFLAIWMENSWNHGREWWTKFWDDQR
jgi:hypothetical protein